jgi:hypothetical protein
MVFPDAHQLVVNHFWGTHGFLVFINDFRDFLVLGGTVAKTSTALSVGMEKHFYFLLGIHAFFFDYKSTTNG